MPTPFFTPERIALMHSEAATWINTPFCLHAMAKGAGVDCVRLCHALAASAGWPHPIQPPRYGARDTMHQDRSVLHEYLDARPCYQHVGDFPEVAAHALPGDLVTFKIGRAAHHLAMMLGGDEFIHVMTDHKVHRSNLADTTYGPRAVRLYRLIEV